MTSKPAVEPQKTLENKHLSGLNLDQARAVHMPAGRPLLIVAGAGTGKTRTLTSRAIHFIEEGVPPESILAVTFTNKAAREMKERIARSGNAGQSGSPLSAPRSHPFIGTFHALGASILRRNAALAGRTPDFVIFDDHDSFALVKKVLKDLDRRKDSPASVAAKISAIKNGAAEESSPPPVREVFARYEAALAAQNALDFDDLLQKAVRLLQNHPGVLQKYRRRFTHILIDEYQDLNDLQYELVKLLAGGGASLTAVGDAEQTIYGWRGSNIEIFLRFPEDWPAAEMVTLTENYRSTQNILQAASGVIRQNVYATRIRRATDLRTANAAGGKVAVAEVLNEEAEAEWIADRIAESKKRGAESASTAILYRTNAQSRALEQELLRRRIPYRVYGGLKFYERREIKDVVAALRISLNPRDEIARERLEKAFGKRRTAALAGTLAAAGAAAPLARIEIFLKAADYFSYIERTMSNPEERRENIGELMHFAAGYPELPPLLQEIALLQAADSLQNGNAEPEVALMTIHLAKGLEFDRVFVAGVSEGLLPHARSLGEKEELQEERRLMYVAMTRARRELYLVFYGLPSRFLGEIPPESAEFRLLDDAPDLNEEYEERYITLD